ncbi:MAG: hypothetical protein R3E32_26665 [Chitinophagales bacterium]
METVSFKMDAYQGFAETEGVIQAGKEVIRIEYQTKDALVGYFKSGLKTLDIPFDDIQDLLFDSNLFTAKLRIQLKTLQAAQDFPTTKGGEIHISISRKNRKQAKSFASSVGLAISQYVMMKDLKEDLEF